MKRNAGVVILEKYIEKYRSSICRTEEELDEIRNTEKDQKYLSEEELELSMLIFEETFIVSVFENALKTLEKKNEL